VPWPGIRRLALRAVASDHGLVLYFDVAMQGSEPVDAAIAGYLREQDAESAAVLAAAGDAGVRRLVSLAFGEESEPFDNPIPEVDGRDAIDRWSAALSVVAVAAPSAFMDAITGKEMDVVLLSILGGVDDPRATAILCQHVADEDWLRRYNSVSALGRRNDAAARPCIDRAAGDPHLVVRAAAIKAVSRSFFAQRPARQSATCVRVCRYESLGRGAHQVHDQPGPSLPAWPHVSLWRKMVPGSAVWRG